MKTITREDLKARIKSGQELTLVEVLPEESFRKFHLPGAINIPVKDGFEERIQKQVPDKHQTIVVYCANKECPASAEAAGKLDELGYTEVYDYEEGKADWQEANLPVEQS